MMKNEETKEESYKAMNSRDPKGQSRKAARVEMRLENVLDLTF